MKKGKGQLTYVQLKRQNENLWRTVLKLQNDYRSLIVAHNKLLKEATNEK